MFHILASLDFLPAEVAIHQTLGTVVGEVLVQEAAFKLGPATVVASYRVELALFGVILTRHTVHRCYIVHRND